MSTSYLAAPSSLRSHAVYSFEGSPAHYYSTLDLFFWLSFLNHHHYHHHRQFRLSSNRILPVASVPLSFWLIFHLPRPPCFSPPCLASRLFSFTPSVTFYLALLPSHPTPLYPTPNPQSHGPLWFPDQDSWLPPFGHIVTS